MQPGILRPFLRAIGLENGRKMPFCDSFALCDQNTRLHAVGRALPWNHEFSPSRRGFANAADARRWTCRSHPLCRSPAAAPHSRILEEHPCLQRCISCVMVRRCSTPGCSSRVAVILRSRIWAVSRPAPRHCGWVSAACALMRRSARLPSARAARWSCCGAVRISVSRDCASVRSAILRAPTCWPCPNPWGIIPCRLAASRSRSSRRA